MIHFKSASSRQMYNCIKKLCFRKFVSLPNEMGLLYTLGYIFASGILQPLVNNEMGLLYTVEYKFASGTH